MSVEHRISSVVPRRTHPQGVSNLLLRTHTKSDSLKRCPQLPRGGQPAVTFAENTGGRSHCERRVVSPAALHAKQGFPENGSRAYRSAFTQKQSGPWGATRGPSASRRPAGERKELTGGRAWAWGSTTPRSPCLTVETGIGLTQQGAALWLVETVPPTDRIPLRVVSYPLIKESHERRALTPLP